MFMLESPTKAQPPEHWLCVAADAELRAVSDLRRHTAEAVGDPKKLEGRRGRW